MQLMHKVFLVTPRKKTLQLNAKQTFHRSSAKRCKLRAFQFAQWQRVILFLVDLPDFITAQFSHCFNCSFFHCYPNHPSSPANTIQMGRATWAIWAAIKYINEHCRPLSMCKTMLVNQNLSNGQARIYLCTNKRLLPNKFTSCTLITSTSTQVII